MVWYVQVIENDAEKWKQAIIHEKYVTSKNAIKIALNLDSLLTLFALHTSSVMCLGVGIWKMVR